MELKESIEILGNLKDYLQIKIDIGYHKLSYNDLGWDFKTVDSITAIDTVLQSLEEYKEAYSDYQELGKEYAKLQDENEKLREIDFTTLYMMGVSDGKTKLENKIKERIEELRPKLEETSKREEKAKEQEEKAVLWCIGIRLDERIKTYEELLKGE